jgi:hypothetical protein
VDTFLKTITPAISKKIMEIRGYEFFSAQMVDAISQSFIKNAMTPAVVQQEITKLSSSRDGYLQTLRTARDSLHNLGIKAEKLEPGHTELGVLVPRDLFHNELEGFQNELRIINMMIRTFYEASNIPPQPIELREISTSDPTLFLGVDVTVLVLFGLCVKWAIDVIKSIIDIKSIVTSSRAANLDQKIIEQIESNMHEIVKNKIVEQTEHLLSSYRGDDGRRNELRQPVHAALEQIVQRVERGMIFELRFLPPPSPGPDEGEDVVKRKKEFDDLAEITASLEFPKIQVDPVLRLTREDPPGGRREPAPGP